MYSTANANILYANIWYTNIHMYDMLANTDSVYLRKCAHTDPAHRTSSRRASGGNCHRVSTVALWRVELD